jgi:hypothetical protein
MLRQPASIQPRTESTRRSIAILVAQADAKETQQAPCALGVNLLVLNANSGDIQALTTICVAPSSPAAALKPPRSENLWRAMHPEICLMRVAEAAKRQRCVDTEGLARGLTEPRTGKHSAIIGEADEALVEGGVPQRPSSAGAHRGTRPGRCAPRFS